MCRVDLVVEYLGRVEDGLGLVFGPMSPEQEPVSKRVVLVLVRFNMKDSTGIVCVDRLGAGSVEGDRNDNALTVDGDY